MDRFWSEFNAHPFAVICLLFIVGSLVVAVIGRSK